jgi:tetratricopeptide (TPR) repeat protein
MLSFVAGDHDHAPHACIIKASQAWPLCLMSPCLRWTIGIRRALKRMFIRHSLRAILLASRTGLPLLFLLLSDSASAAFETPRSLDEYFNQARELETRQDFAGAEKIYQAALAAFPNQPEILKRLGFVYQTELKFQESIETFQTILQQVPEYPEVNFFMGLSYFGLNQFERAIESFQKELAINSNYRRARYYAGLAYQSIDQIPEAIQQFDVLVKEDPKDTKALYQLARIHRAASIAAIKQLSQVDPDSILFHALRAESYSEDEKYPEAIKEYQRVLSEDQSFPGVHFGLGELYHKTGNPGEAEKEFRLALQEDPNHPMANYYVAELLLRTQKYEEAIPLLKISIAADPKFVAAYFQLGKCYVATGKPQEALSVLLKAEGLNPNSKMTHYQLAQVYGRLNDDAKRKHHLEVFERLTQEEKQTKLKKSDDLLEAERQREVANEPLPASKK